MFVVVIVRHVQTPFVHKQYFPDSIRYSKLESRESINTNIKSTHMTRSYIELMSSIKTRKTSPSWRHSPEVHRAENNGGVAHDVRAKLRRYWLEQWAVSIHRLVYDYDSICLPCLLLELRNLSWSGTVLEPAQSEEMLWTLTCWRPK